MEYNTHDDDEEEDYEMGRASRVEWEIMDRRGL